jgi:glycosyltransferase involved in cell wall biosynthesis
MAKKRSVAIYLPNLAGGGVERIKLTLVDAFVENGLDVTFVLNRADGELMAFVPPSVKVVSLEAGRTLAALPKLIRYLRSEQPDILLSSLGHNNIVALWARRLARVKTAVIIGQHNSLRNESASMGNWQHRVLPFMYRLFGRWADAILAVSKGVADDLAEAAKLPRDSISVIYNPVIHPRFLKLMAEPVEHPWFDDPDIRVFVGVGRLVLQKDFPSLIHAFAAIPADANARLLIFGEGPLRGELQALIDALGLSDRVQLAGFCANPYPYVRRSAAMVMSSRYEGFGNVLVEALGCGTPVISTDCPHGPAEILENGKYGPLITVGDVKGLSEAMESILTDRLPRNVLIERAQEFSLDRIVGAYLSLFEKVSPAYPGRTAVRSADPEAAPIRSVAIYLPNLAVGGTEISMVHLANGLAQRGLKSWIIVHGVDDHLVGQLRNVELIRLSAVRTMTALPELIRFLRQHRPDILLGGLTHNNLIAILARLIAGGASRVVVTEHAPVSSQIEAEERWNYKALPYLVPLLYPKADAVVAVSEGVREDLYRFIPKTGMEVIHNPILPQDWQSRSTASIDDAWFAEDAPPVVLSAGRLSKEKDYSMLIRAFAKVWAKRPSARLAILGEGTERAPLQELIAELNLKHCVRLLGFKANVFPYMSRATVFVLPSRFEGFGNVLVEAMVCGAKVVSTDCPVGPREILGGGRYGTLVPVGDVDAMSEAILEALDSAAGTDSAVTWAMQFTIDKSVERYLELFNGLATEALSGAVLKKKQLTQ